MYFKRGDVINYDDREVVLDKTFAQKYWGDDNSSWEAKFIDSGGSIAWVHPTEENFIRHEDETIFEKLKVLKAEIYERNRDMEHIKETVLNGINFISSTSILKLFEEISYVSAFERNGEYYVLYHDYAHMHLAFVKMFEGKYEEMIQIVHKIFRIDCVDRYKLSFTALYNKVNGA